MARHEYFRPADEKSPSVAAQVVFWAVAMAVCGAASVAFLDRPAVGLPLLVAAFVAMIAWRVRTAVRPRVVREFQAAQLDRLRERIPEAIARCRALLRSGLGPYLRAQALLVLGECAEQEGDFAEAAEIFVLAEGRLRSARVNAVLLAQQLAVVAARRAFAHAACGELDRAEATLRTAGVRDGVPLAGPLSSRAMLLVLARRGLKQQVIERLATDAKLLRNGLAFRDRSLVAVVGAFAASRAIPHGSVDPAIVPWLTRAFPEAAAILGGTP
jgi:tetratricopeptide (TPR) repeat protein